MIKIYAGLIPLHFNQDLYKKLTNNMDNIIKSATKIILLMFAIVLSMAYLYSVLSGQVTVGQTFDRALMLVFGFYFAYKGETNQKYAGK